MFGNSSFPTSPGMICHDFLVSFGLWNATSWVHEVFPNYLDDGFPGDFKSKNEDKYQYFRLSNQNAKIQ